MREFDSYCHFADIGFRSGVEIAFCESFSEVANNPLRRARSLSLLRKPVKLLTRVSDDIPLPKGWEERLTLNVELPNSKHWTRATLAVEHRGFTALAFLDISLRSRNRIALFGKRTANGWVPAGTLYHTFDPRIFAGKKNDELRLIVLPLRGLEPTMLEKVRSFRDFSVTITSVNLFLLAD